MEYNPEIFILRKGMICNYLHPDQLDQDRLWSEANGYKSYVFDAAEWRSIDDFHKGMLSGLPFPTYYGRNLSAFEDSLLDIGLKDGDKVLMVFENFAEFNRKFPD